jgi:hypothetical protein
LSNSLLALISHGQTKAVLNSWQQVQHIVRAGLHHQVFQVGDQFMALFDGEPFVWDVIGIDHDKPTDPRFVHSLTIQSHDCLLDAQFSAPQALYYAETPLPAGQHRFTLNNVQYSFTTSQTVPAGGQVRISGWGEGDVPTAITTYAADRTTTIETDLVVTQSAGADTLSPVNHHQRCRYGSNNYVESAIRQWLNSEDETFVWEPQTPFDRPSTTAPYTGGGFLHLLDPDLVAVLGAVDKQVARNTATDGGGQDLFSDKVFLLSRVEVYGGTEGETGGEAPYPYYESMVPSPTPDALDGRIKYLGASATNWWLRSPYTVSAIYPRYVTTSGSVNVANASTPIGVAPAVVIV